MLRTINGFRYVLILLAILGLSASTLTSRADPYFGDDYTGYQVSGASWWISVSALDINITYQSPFNWTDHATINGTLSVNYAPAVSFTGKIDWDGWYDGWMALSYWKQINAYHWQLISYQGEIYDDGSYYSAYYVIPNGTFTTQDWVWVPWYSQWFISSGTSGTFSVQETD